MGLRERSRVAGGEEQWGLGGKGTEEWERRVGAARGEERAGKGRQ